MLSPLRAQLSAGAGIGALAERRSAPEWQRSPLFRSTLRYDQRWSQLGLDGVVIRSGDGLRLERGLVHGTFAPPPVGVLRLSANGQLEQLAPSLVAARTALTLEAALSATVGAGGAWIGAAVEGVREMDSLPGSPMLRVGGWRRFGNAMITISSASHAMRLGGRSASFREVPFQDSVLTDSGLVWRTLTRTERVPGVRSKLRRWSDVELRGSWAVGRAAFDVAAGTRRGLDSLRQSTWARVGTAVELTPRLAITAAAGREPSRIILGIPPARYARIGLRVAPAALARPSLPAPVRASPAAFAIRSADSGYYVVSVRVPRARTVELSGDFDAWTPIALQQTRPGIWDVTLRLAPGTYRINVRVDGDRWTAPPGTPTVADEFNGTVGLVVVR
jgi:hypothetical protein